MAQSVITHPLGLVLQKVGLVSPAQIQVVLQDQQYQPNLRIGDILELRGWVDRDAIEFFAEQWPKLAHQPRNRPIGYYLQQSTLLDSNQIQDLLQEQAQAGMRIGALAVLRGWLSQETLDLFIRHLSPEDAGASPFVTHGQTGPAKSVPSPSGKPTAKPDPQPEASTGPEPGEIPWVD
ncbi:hypothetical protein C7271_14290 [filamentous cyanobacterium CCP5]|nr:hypothetical protein C7271_14290 [filamentous cyanobacterium CCP5]